MALQGRIQTATASGAGGAYFYISWTATQNIAKNQSTVKWTAGLHNGTVRWFNLAVQLLSGSRIGLSGIAPATYSYLEALNVDIPLQSGSFTITHDANGYADFDANLRGWLFSVGNLSADKQFTLNQIKRASSFTLTSDVTLVGGSGTTGPTGRSTVSITREVAATTHSIKWVLGTKSYTISQATQGTSTTASYNPPVSWNDEIPNAETKTGTVTVTTYLSGSQLGSAVTKNWTARVPDQAPYLPTIGDFTDTRVNNALSPAIPSGWNEYVQDRSRSTLAITGAVAGAGATIKAYKIAGHGFSTAASTASATTSVITQSGNIVYTATVTDSRGRSVNKTVPITVRPYEQPQLKDYSAQRSDVTGSAQDDGQYINIKMDACSYSTVNSKNTATATARWRAVGTTSWSSATTLSGWASPGGTTLGAGAISNNLSYEVQLTFADYFITQSAIVVVPTAYTTMDFKAGGRGVAIGKVSEYDDLLDVGMDARFRGVATFDNPISGLINVSERTYPTTAITATAGGSSVTVTRNYATLTRYSDGYIQLELDLTLGNIAWAAPNAQTGGFYNQTVNFTIPTVMSPFSTSYTPMVVATGGHNIGNTQTMGTFAIGADYTVSTRILRVHIVNSAPTNSGAPNYTIVATPARLKLIVVGRAA